MNYTKGTWKANAFGVRTDNIEVADCVLGEKRQPGMRIVEAQANANLISKSPQMIELLQRLVNDGWSASISMEAEEIIQSAEGRDG